MEKIRLGISSCLLGEEVRYDGSHKLDHYLKETLGRFVEWTPVCPEVECGLPVPRKAMRLMGTPEAPRLVAVQNRTDHTEQMTRWSVGRLKELGTDDLCGFIFKSRSPSSGTKGVKVYGPSGVPSRSGRGIFARAYMERFPITPVEDDERLWDPVLRENFLERVFVFRRWKDLQKKRCSPKNIIAFHSDHKLLLLSHSTTHYKALGRLVANTKQYKIDSLSTEYITTLMEGLKLIATVKKNTNVLLHTAGYFKKSLQADEKKELLEMIEAYHCGLVPLIVPITLLDHYVGKYGDPYLKRQHYLSPHPIELMMRNHA